ncbi:zinc finger protein 43-like [Argonauta hians]
MSKTATSKDSLVVKIEALKSRQTPTRNSKLLSDSKKHKCPVCAFTTNYKSDINRHSQKHRKCLFSCDICKKPFMSMGTVFYHKLRHHPQQTSDMKPKFSCTMCPYGSMYKSNLKRHLQHHPHAKYICYICRFPFDNFESLDLHLKTWHSSVNNSSETAPSNSKVTPISCELPPVHSLLEDSDYQHQTLREASGSNSDVTSVYRQSISQQNSGAPISGFRYSGDRDRHQQNSEPQTSGFRYSDDGDRHQQNSEPQTSGFRYSGDRDRPQQNSEPQTSGFRYSDDGDRPQQNSEPQISGYRYSGDGDRPQQNPEPQILGFGYSGDRESPQVKVEAEKMQCTFCSKLFEDQSMLDFHILHVHIEAKFSLSSGEQLSENSSYIVSGDDTELQQQQQQQQQVRESQQDVVVCPYCVYQTHSQFLMDNHIREYHVTNTCACTKCSMSFENAQSLNQNNSLHDCPPMSMTEHETSCKYQCNMCPYSTDYKSTFNRHILRHSVAKFQCDECKMPFMREGNLLLHQKENHKSPGILREHRYQCPHCCYASSYRITMQRHLYKHEVAVFKCDLCNMPFIHRGNLSQHKRLQHGPTTGPSPTTTTTITTTTPNPPENILLTTASSPRPPGPVVCQDPAPHRYRDNDDDDVIPVQGTCEPVIVCPDERSEDFPCPYCPMKFSSQLDFLHHMKVQVETTYHRYTPATSPLLQHQHFDNNVLPHYTVSSSSSHGAGGFTGDTVTTTTTTRHIIPMNETTTTTTPVLTNNQLTLNDMTESPPRFLASVTNFQTEHRQNYDTLNYIEIDDDEDEDEDNEINSNDIDNDNNDNDDEIQENIVTTNQETAAVEEICLDGSGKNCGNSRANIGKNSGNSGANVGKNSGNSGANIGPKQSATFGKDPHLVKHCDKETQCALISSDVTSVRDSHPGPLGKAPHRGRYVKLVSDFDDFAERPFACALCYHRYGKYEELKVHVQNHLTGAGGFDEIPATASFPRSTSD